ncbi:hypothetical protein ACT29H_03245 [Thermophagus sp. OGC60D27]|uniref:hypothetical protein n=1 Tax=Thermophagus sp. OGC60D27 TaxID=3458415 RepID=UPI0040383E26
MPYRRLPNTDQARLRALKTAQNKGVQTEPKDLAFSPKLLFDVKVFVPQFEQAIRQYQFSKDRQTNFGKKLTENFRVARMYLSHFLQVVNMAITRGELKPNVRTFYGLSEIDKTLPEINTEQQLLQWGMRVIKGEEERMAQGGSRVFNPTIAMVKVHFEKFVENYNVHKDLVKTSQKMQVKVAQERETADNLILNIWNEVEAFYSHLEPDKKREKASEYGVVYIFRPSEIAKKNS